MTEPSDSRVGLYIDFDNIVISRYQQLHGRNAFQRDGIRNFDRSSAASDPLVTTRLNAATVDFNAIIDFAASFGTLVVNRAYADWSVPVNASYQRQLMSRAVDLTQLFTTTTRGTKNGADIRLAVDVVEDLFRLPDLTHIIIVAGDSDYIALAQKSKRLGRFVVGIGVAGSTSTSLAAACDEFEDYDSLPGIAKVTATAAAAAVTAPVTAEKPPSGRAAPEPEVAGPQTTPIPVRQLTTIPMFSHTDDSQYDEPEPADDTDPQTIATKLLVRALQIGHAKGDADEWLNTGSVKNQMRRMDPSFNEKPLGFRSFTDFLSSRGDVAELDEDGPQRLIRLRPEANTGR
ncbi:NYN domain-containing protein [Cryobacterium sp. TMT1-21]|uniref:NYN domain-containing protein n=1 Tax=Cryobacterium shii TaxID=1259235 RepID=A0AAQ2HFY3_9MICO|nr:MULTISPECIES: NYN domain-containing protein [Cryobacterium]TFC48884.1 NYN domain-containing protein [Cryobacterium shii]TFC82959.1 NYN domain-containing protein [Cryobacterium sp. TmT2-59]TFD12572.1 NYN domain-containing protein [Cryobacterium sp. TMT1-21]TFD17245.1 NYN domain-containing protein [Cryobacterium sp. TMT4-10]TFD25736.1 NYN domain-containing protein [Cryobacterium sp. TMT2-23]